MGRFARGGALLAAAAAVLLAAPTPAAALPPPPDLSKEYWFVNWDIANVWAAGAQGQGITVAIVDTGVQAGRPELAGRVLPGTDLAGGDGRTDVDPQGHGTRMADLIVGQGGPAGLVGVAPQARILPVRVHPRAGSTTSDSLIEAGIRYATDHRAQVINVSQGGSGACAPDMADAVRYAVEHGSIVVAAAGNEGDTTNLPESPGDCPGIVAVGAVNGNKVVWPSTQRQPYVDVAAPGVEIYGENLQGQVGTGSGTSDAAALTSGAIALVWSKFPRLTNRQVLARILATVTDDASTPGKDDATGYGIVRPHVAIRTDVPPNAPNPIFDELENSPSGSASPSTGTSTPPTSGRPTTPTAVTAHSAGSSGGVSSGAIAGIVAVVALAGAALALLLRARRRTPA